MADQSNILSLRVLLPKFLEFTLHIPSILRKLKKAYPCFEDWNICYALEVGDQSTGSIFAVTAFRKAMRAPCQIRATITVAWMEVLMENI